MALIKCYECGEMVSDKAASCPKCGAPLRNNSEINHVAEIKQPRSYKRKNLIIIGVCILLLLLCTGLFYITRSNGNIVSMQDKGGEVLKVDSIEINEVNNSYSTRIFFRYPEQIDGYDMSEFHKVLFQRTIIDSWHGNQGWLKQEMIDLNFKAALQKIFSKEEVRETVRLPGNFRYAKGYTLYVNYFYDKNKRWISVNKDENVGRAWNEDSFIYDLNQQKVLSFDDVFIPEKQDELKKLICKKWIKRIESEMGIFTDIGTSADGRTIQEIEYWDFNIYYFSFYHKGENYYLFNCYADLRSAYGFLYSETGYIHISEKELTPFLTYTPE